MNSPITLPKETDAIEKLKLYLAGTWGLQFRPGYLGTSPSQGSRDAVDERVHSYIRFLHYSKSSLDGIAPLKLAIDQFEQEAPTILSLWQFKPRAEAGVVPSPSITNSPVRHDFLHRSDALGDGPSRDLMLRFEHLLGDIVQKVRRGQHKKADSATMSKAESRSRTSYDNIRSSSPDVFDDDDDLFASLATENFAAESDTYMKPPTTPSRRRRLDQQNGTDGSSSRGGESLRPIKIRKASKNDADTAEAKAQMAQATDPGINQKSTPSFISSVSSSMTSALSNFTSPNTSFSTITQSDNLMDIDWDFMSISDDMPTTVAQVPLSQSSQTCPEFSMKLRSGSPFMAQKIIKEATVPLRQIYEVERVARAAQIDISTLSEHLTKREDDLATFWTSICKKIESSNRDPPEQSSSIAWEKAQTDFWGVSMTAKLRFFDTFQDGYFGLELKPLKLEPTYRFSRHFHGDRFLVLSIPGLEPRDLPPYLKGDADRFRNAFIDWLVSTRHEILGRLWRTFYIKPGETKLKQPGKPDSNSNGFRVYLFAEDGQDFGSVIRTPDPLGEPEWRLSRILPRPYVPVQEVIEWFMPFDQNRDQKLLKFFARLSLGLTSTVRTLEFKPRQVVRSNDAFADSPRERRLDVSQSDLKKTGRGLSQNQSAVMNDGCARISRSAARQIAVSLQLDYTPSVFQGRIGGAKGIWMVDALEENPYPGDVDGLLWIEVTDSQLKFEPAPIDSLFPDADRVTFEANSSSRPLSPAYLNYQLLPILLDRGVPREIFQRLLKEGIDTQTADLEDALECGLALRRWCQANYPTTADRSRKKGIEMLGGIPDSRSERLNWFVDHGFEPKECASLEKLVFGLVKDYCAKLKSRMNIELASSTNAFMIADPLNVLEPDEIHISFSANFNDSQGFGLSMLHGVDVLVARLPALLPSDIQKVRAVFKPELGIYRDVIIFSSRGDQSLASKLSGGDYDGDKAWICWDHSIVAPFQNASVPKQPPPESYGIDKDLTEVSDIMQYPNDYTDRFLRYAFNFNMKPKMLGIITRYHEYLCYARNSISTPEAISIAQLLGLIVDSSKSGFNFPNSKWSEYRDKHQLPASFPKPAYRDQECTKPKNDNLIDNLVFNTTRPVCEAFLTKIYKKISDAKTFDEDLTRLSRIEMLEAETDPSLAQALSSLRTACDRIVTHYRTNCSRYNEDDWNNNNNFKPHITSTKTHKPTSPGFRALIEKIRADFLAIPPCPNDAASLAAVSSKVRQWAKEYYQSASSATGGPSDHWSLVKASLAFSIYHSSSCIWYMAGLELGELKAKAKGRGSYRTVVNGVFDALKVDGRLADAFMEDRLKTVDGKRSRRALEEGFVVGLEAEEEEDGEEFGEWGWEDGY